MAASFPVTFPSALSITGSQTLESVGHTDNLHIKDRDEIIAAQTKLGLGSSVASGTTALLGTGGTQSAWGQITNAYISGTAAIAVSKLAPASANGSVMTTAAGTATWALLTNNNIAGTAAIAVSKLATDTKGYALLAGASAPQFDPIDRKNLLINGMMRVSQRRALDSQVNMTDNAYQAADRWRSLFGASTDVGKTAGTPTIQTSSVWYVNGGSNRSLLAVSVDGATIGLKGTNSTKFGVFQVLESLDSMPYRGIPLSLQARIHISSSTLTDMRIALLEYRGTAEAAAVSSDPISSWGVNGSNPTLAADWYFVNTPSSLSLSAGGAGTVVKIENVTPSTSMTHLAVMVWANDGSTHLTNDFFFTNDVQLEVGTICTRPERLPYAQELQMCQRYYFKTFPQSLTPAQNTGNANGALAYVAQVGGTTAGNGAMLRYPSIMRASPTVTFFNISAANTKWRNVSIGADSATPVTVGPNESGVFVTNAQVAGDLVSHQIMVHLTADAEL